MRMTLLFLSGILLLLLPARAASAAPQDQPRPNFVLILVDDLGATDLGCFGSTFYETPHLDRMAREGMQFTTAYAACTVCSPTRAAVLTGRYPARLHLTDWIAGHKRPYAKLRVPAFHQQLPLEEVTIAEALKPAGYVSASIGKWHLGGDGFLPKRQGFDLNVAGDHRGQPPSYFDPFKIPTLADAKEGEYLTDRLTREAEAFLTQNKDRPFFLYLPHYGVHTPLQAKPEVVAKYKAKSKPGDPHSNATYAAMIESVDDSVGRLLKKLDELKIADRTVVFVTSDNGGLLNSTTNLGLRAGKGSAYEGGVRVPLLVRWPGVVKPGSVCAEPVISVDFFPTIMEIPRFKHFHEVDGHSMVGHLRQLANVQRDGIYWHYPHYHPGGATPYGAVRSGDWKYIEFYEDGRGELYNLKEDPAEKHDLAAKWPEAVASLRQKLAKWRMEMNAQMPMPNPDYDPRKDVKKVVKPLKK